MALDNLLGMSGDVELARVEERLSKKRALEMYDEGILKTFEVGTFKGLSQVHEYLFQDVYDFAGKRRTVNIAKGGFRFAPVMYLDAALEAIDAMDESDFDTIVEKYVEMNVAHPFREGNGRATRIWLDNILAHRIGKVIDWSQVNKEDCLLAMERSPVRDTEIKSLLRAALTDQVDDREVFIKGIDASYGYEGYGTYRIKEL